MKPADDPAEGPNGSAVRVFARFRPPNHAAETTGAWGTCVNIASDGRTVALAGRGSEGPQCFTFDGVFGPAASQAEVYDAAARELVQNVLAGFHGTFFAYGQSGSGKTYTMAGAMEGGSGEGENDGVISRAARQIFDAVGNTTDGIEYEVKLSCVEIYKERVRCLLDTSGTKADLDVRADRMRGVHVVGATELPITSAEHFVDVASQAMALRCVSSTGLNDASSRSHMCIVIAVKRRDVLLCQESTGRLHLVDLAGSESLGKTGAVGDQLEEAKLINKSLTTLGLVIKALTDGHSSHVPYRDSKLTRILQDALGGSSRTCLLLACSPSMLHSSETLSTLRFGARAKQIRNTPKAHVLSEADATGAVARQQAAEIAALREEVARLVAALAGAGKDLETSWARSGSLSGDRPTACDARHSCGVAQLQGRNGSPPFIGATLQLVLGVAMVTLWLGTEWYVAMLGRA